MPFHPFQLAPLIFSLLATQSWAAPNHVATEIETEALERVLMFVEHKDCAGAVKALNKGIADKYPNVMLLAGSMFEAGICVKPDWDKAAGFFQLAHAAGQQKARPRLISGYAEKNRDPGAALWWLAKHGGMPAPCAAADHLVDDPDAFVAALNKWPKGQVAACVYTGGVAMRVAGDIEFPGRGPEQGVFGDAHMHFVPSAGTITWTAGSTGRISTVRVEQAGDDEGGVFKHTFLKHMRAVSERALKQFTRPEGIDPTWVIDTKFSFTYQY